MSKKVKIHIQVRIVGVIFFYSRLGSTTLFQKGRETLCSYEGAFFVSDGSKKKKKENLGRSSATVIF